MCVKLIYRKFCDFYMRPDNRAVGRYCIGCSYIKLTVFGLMKHFNIMILFYSW